MMIKNFIYNIQKLAKKQLSFQILLSLLIGILLGIIIKNTFLSSIIKPNIFKEIGYLFIRLIKFASGPLVFISISVSILKSDNIGSSKKTIIFTTIFSLIFTSISSLVGMLSELFFQFGKNINFDIKSVTSTDDIIKTIGQNETQISLNLLNIIPNNIFEPFIKNDFLQIILCALLFSFAVLKTEQSLYSKKILSFFEIFQKVFTKLIFIFSKISPIGTFGITVWIITSQDFNFIKSIGIFVILEAFNAFFIVHVVYGIALFLMKLNPFCFWKKCIPIQAMAFLTSSTMSTLPFAMKLSKEKLGISEDKVNLVMPYSATINMNGGAMHFSLATIFVGHLFGIEFSIYQYFLIFFMSIVCSIGTAPVPGFSIFLLGNIFHAVGVPIEGVLILFGINTITDMFRTYNNITGDIFLTLLVDKKIGNFNKEKFHN